MTTVGRVRARNGQAALEYVLALAALLAAGGVVWTLARVAARDAERIGRLVAGDSP